MVKGSVECVGALKTATRRTALAGNSLGEVEREVFWDARGECL